MCRIAISALDLLAKRCFSPDEPFPRLPVSFLQRACSEGGVGDLVAKNILLVHPLTLVCITRYILVVEVPQGPNPFHCWAVFLNCFCVCWDRSGIVLGSCWDRFAMVLGSSW